MKKFDDFDYSIIIAVVMFIGLCIGFVAFLHHCIYTPTMSLQYPSYNQKDKALEFTIKNDSDRDWSAEVVGVSFYDDNGYFLETQEGRFQGLSKGDKGLFSVIPSKDNVKNVARFKIVECHCETPG